MNWQEILETIVGWATTAGVRLVIALVAIVVLFKIINFVGKKIEKSADTKHADKTIMRTVAYIFKLGVKVVVVICLVGYVGIDTSGLTALVASFGVCIGLAVNGALSNLAGGVLIILTRPFRIDDYIEAQGYSGTVEDIHITYTRLRTPDNKIIFVPNGPLSSDTIVNYSLQDLRRVDEVFSISYTTDFRKAQQIVTEICTAHPLVLQDPAPFVRIGEHAASSINITTRVWVNNEDYWTVKFDLLEQVKERFDKEGIEIPFNQMDVHIKRD